MTAIDAFSCRRITINARLFLRSLSIAFLILSQSSNSILANTTQSISKQENTLQEIQLSTDRLAELSINDALASLPRSQDWLDHLEHDLIPFWTVPDALGDPMGRFPSVRCNDGSRYDRQNPCPEVKNNTWLTRERDYTLSISRQVYSHGVAFHLTGDPRYLRYAKAGVDYLREQARDQDNGGMYGFWDVEHESWQPEFESRNAQEQAGALLGLSFYYYLTRDPEVLTDILAIKDFIFDTYYNSEIGMLQWQPKSSNDSQALRKELTAQLDQINAYLVLLIPILPEPYQTVWKQDLLKLTNVLLTDFYSSDNAWFFTAANSLDDQDIAVTKVNLGHNMKIARLLRTIGRIADKPLLVDFADTHTHQILNIAYLPESGSWASLLEPNNTINIDKESWIYAELDQGLASYALENPSVLSYLTKTYEYWFENFVDEQHGGIWNALDGLSHIPKNNFPKHWMWKSGFHVFEHALISYMTSAELHQELIRLYYGFEGIPETNTIQPYLYKANIERITKVNLNQESVVEVIFSGLE